MQPLARDGLTTAQVRQLLVGSAGVVYNRGLEVLDAALNVVGDISTELDSGNVAHAGLADIAGTCSLRVTADLDYGRQLARPFLDVGDGTVTARFRMGAYVLRRPSSTYGQSPRTSSIDGSDRVLLLQRPVGNSYSVAADTGYLAAVRQVIADSGLSASTVLLDGTAQDKTLPAAKVWSLFQPDGTTATTWLRIVNDLLSPISYRGLWTDELGKYRSEPYADPASRGPEFTFDLGPDSILDPLRTVTQDLSQVPNAWVFLQQNLVDASGNPAEPVEGAGQYTPPMNQSDGPTSIDGRGGLRFLSVVRLDAADQASLVRQGNSRVAADRRVTKVITVRTAPFPAAGHLDVYTYIDSEAGGRMKVQETAWTQSLGTSAGLPDDMDRTWQVVA